jgi:NAD(P)-dependent dehydrogenase (short-subunit alcohol dehydrogenase family)
MGAVPEPILVLGASGGIGSAIARRLVRDGHAVILHGRSKARLEELAAEVGTASSIEVADLTDPGAVEALLARVREAHGKLRGLIFAVAVPFANKLTHRTLWTAFQEQVDTQLKAFHLVASAAYPLLLKAEGTKRLVLVSTEFVTASPPIKTAPYVAAKAAVTIYAQVIAKEWLPRGIRVHIVAPGLVKTAMVADMPDEFLDQMAQAMPEKRLTTAVDVADMVAFMMTEAADPLYGTPVRVSRGARS